MEAVNAANVVFRRNTFTCLGAVALNLENDVQDAEVVGNVFQWVEGGGVSVGHPQHVYIGKQNGDNAGYGPYNIDNSHDKYDETREGLAKRVTVANNVFRNTVWVWWDMSPIAMYYGHSVHILHNDLWKSRTSASRCGWGWGEFNGLRAADKCTKVGRETGGFPSLSTRDLKVNYNRVLFPYRKLNDAGALYFLGDCATPAKNILAQSDFSEVRGNYVVEQVPSPRTIALHRRGHELRPFQEKCGRLQRAEHGPVPAESSAAARPSATASSPVTRSTCRRNGIPTAMRRTTCSCTSPWTSRWRKRSGPPPPRRSLKRPAWSPAYRDLLDAVKSDR